MLERGSERPFEFPKSLSVWVVAELSDAGVLEASLEALGEARTLCGAGVEAPAVIVAGEAVPEQALNLLAAHGAERILCLEAEHLEEWSPAHRARLLTDALGAVRPTTVLLAHTALGRALAPRLAVALDAGCATDCIVARRRPDGSMEVTRPAFGGRVHATVTFSPTSPAVITIQPGSIGVDRAIPGRRAALERRPIPQVADQTRSRRRRLIAPDPRHVDLKEAERIVAGGRGVGGTEGFVLLQELADLLGAAVGGSRVAVDLGWLPWERQIGQSGRNVTPRVYLACGISGASQHLVGIRDADSIIAINSDRSAPIFSIAQLGIVGDWRAVVTALIDRLRARTGPSPPPARAGERQQPHPTPR
jgi:electron transfer flavoprotein alpha subunit